MPRFLALPLLLLIAACANQPCDPRADRNILQVGNCVLSGSYQQRVDSMQARLSQAEADQRLAADQLAAARRGRDAVEVERAQLRSDLASERLRTTQIERDIAAARARGNVNRDRLAAIEGQLATLRAEQEALRNQQPGPETQRQLADVQRRRQALEGTFRDIGRAVVRE
ncbi:hypothetical protein ACVFYP_13300 [Roseomonas sp. F4]